MILAVNGRSIAGAEQRRRHQPHQGPGRHAACTLAVFTPGEADDAHRHGQARAHRGAGRAAASMVEQRRPQDRRRASCQLQLRRPRGAARARSTSCSKQGAEGDRARPARQRRRPARTRACSCRASSSRTARSSPCAGATAPSSTHERRRATPSTPKHPGGRARGRRQRQRLRDRDRRAARPPPRDGRRHAHVRQGRSSRRSSRSRTAACSTSPSAHYYLPDGETISTGTGIKPQVRAERQPEAPSATRRCPSRSTRCCASSMSAAVRGRRPGRGRLDEPIVAVLEKRGRFLVAEPLFGRGPASPPCERGGGGRSATWCSSAAASAARACCAGSAGPTSRATCSRA